MVQLGLFESILGALSGIVRSTPKFIPMFWYRRTPSDKHYQVSLSLIVCFIFIGVFSQNSVIAEDSPSLLPVYSLLLKPVSPPVIVGTTMSIPPTDPMTAEERIAAFEKVQNIANTLVTNNILPPVNTPINQRDQEEELKVIAQALVELPEVLTVIIDESGFSATVLLADGFSMALVNNRAPDSITDIVLDDEHYEDVIEQFIERDTTLPGSNDAIFVAIDGGQQEANELSTMLTSNGYQLATSSGSIEAMTNLYKNLGFLYLDTHGVSYQHVTPIINNTTGKVISAVWGDYFYGVQTDSKVFQDDLINYKDELATGEIIVTVVPSQVENKWDFKFAVTQSFIERNWSFSNGGVILHTCFGGAGPFSSVPLFGQRECYGACPSLEELGRTVLDPRPIRQAILNKGAEILMSFDDMSWATSAKPTTSFFIDRMMGANEIANQPDPPPRPYDYDNIRSEMESKGLMSYLHGTRLVNVTIETKQKSLALAPSIKHMDIIDDIQFGPGKLSLEGIFGTRTGTVEVDGVPLTVESWTNDKVDVRIPYDASPTHGEIIAATPDNTKSNGVPLTEWEGKITLSQTSSGLESKAEIDVVFRADVHKFRNSSNGNLQERVVKTYISPRTSGEASGSGSVNTGALLVQYVPSINPASRNMTIFGKLAVDALSGARMSEDTQSISPSAADGVSEFAGVLSLDPAQDKAEICMWILGFHDILYDGTRAPAAGLVQLLPQVTDRSQGLLGCVNMTLNDDYTISSGQKVHVGDGFSIKLQWTEFTPSSPPGGNTQS